MRTLLRAPQSWPKTIGTIIESGINPHWEGGGGRYRYIVSPNVIYEYDVAGKRYTGSQLALVQWDTASADFARTKAEKYSVGQKVDVYYDPRKPASATLRVGDPTGGKLPIGIIISGTALAITGIIWFLTIRK